MNARANAGESFPAEIPIDPDSRHERRHAAARPSWKRKDGWLTIGWILAAAGAGTGACTDDQRPQG